MEVGFARSSYSNIDQGYNSAKEQLLEIWKREDQEQKPSYKSLNPQIKNVSFYINF